MKSFPCTLSFRNWGILSLLCLVLTGGALFGGVIQRMSLPEWLAGKKGSSEIVVATLSNERFIKAPEINEEAYKTVFTATGQSLISGLLITLDVSVIGGLHGYRPIYSTSITPADGQMAEGKKVILFLEGKAPEFKLAGFHMVNEIVRNSSGNEIVVGNSNSNFFVANRALEDFRKEVESTAKNLGIK